MRLCACLDLPLHIIEPCGFLLDDRKLRRAGMDYRQDTQLTRHDDWTAFTDAVAPARLILASAHAAEPLHDATAVVLGRERELHHPL